MDYHFREIELKWRTFWAEHKTFHTSEDFTRPKYYILDMFPYPSGAGLHVGHPLGYIASDILARYKRLEGYNVLHPMGYDAFGLPAEQYAIQTGQHPALTTAENIKRYREQLDDLGFSFDWSREVRTSDPEFYKWTQWIFIQFFNSWYNLETNRAEPLTSLIERFERQGNLEVKASTGDVLQFDAGDWAHYTEVEKEEVLMGYRLAFQANSTVNWCAGLGTVLANEEVKDGYSERGGFPVVRKQMRQWFLRITAYAGRLLEGLKTLDWSESVKEMQRNWIGRSQGASLTFKVTGEGDVSIEVFTTRPDTVFGCTFLVLAPEYEDLENIVRPALKEEVDTYVRQSGLRSERDRQADIKTVSGAFTGAYAVNPFTGEDIPIYIAGYVLAGYGTGAVMAVPSGDERDFKFARHFGLSIVPVVEGYDADECYTGKEGTLKNSDFLDGLSIPAALTVVISEIEKRGLGKGKVNYRLRDAGFSRQRYWGEPFPVYYKDGVAHMLPDAELPLILPQVDKYLPTETGDPPLGRAAGWTTMEGYPLEINTMPGWAGSSWYFLRYMDPDNPHELASSEKIAYWKGIDLYLGGSEHATGHLLYVRLWTKFLYDLGISAVDEPAKKLVNQGMIQGRSSLIYRLRGTAIYFSADLYKRLKADGDADIETGVHPQTAAAISDLIRKKVGAEVFLEAGKVIHGASFKDTDQIRNYPIQILHVDVNMVHNDFLDEDAYKSWRPETAGAVFISEGDKFTLGSEVEKMSKSKLNVVNPDDVIASYGADTLRMYEMFLGPLELAKPWNTNGIEGVFKFLRKFWRLFHDDEGGFKLAESKPSAEALKSLHKMIRKATEDLEKLSFNTSVSSFMICVNELGAMKCCCRAILEPLLVLLSPYAPHICEELWERAGKVPGSISQAVWPRYDPDFLIQSSFNYPISINGKTRFNITFSLDLSERELEEQLVQNALFRQHIDGRVLKKIIIVRGRIINLVI